MALTKKEFCREIPVLLGKSGDTRISEVNYYCVCGSEIVEVVWNYGHGDTNRVLINVSCNSNLAILEEVLKEALGEKSLGRLSRAREWGKLVYEAVDKAKGAK